MGEPTKAIFLSYAREDAEAARRIAEALRAFGVEVWFDQNELRGGDQWDQKIRTQIKTCALFVPIISQQTEERAEGYFRREWKLAVDRTQDMGSSRAFIVPVVIDDTKESGADVPEEFMRYQWTRLAGGEPTPEFVTQVKRLLDSPRKPAGRRTAAGGQTTEDGGRTAEDGGRKAAASGKGRPKWGLAAAAVVVFGISAYFGFRPASAPVSAPAASAAPTAGIAAGQSAPTDLSAAGSAKVDKSVAVLAFADLSEARNSEHFSDGVSEELLNVLAKVPGLRVAARTSAFFFKGKNLPIPEIAQKLHVAYVVEGSVQRAGDRVKITAQLIKAADGFHVWSDTFTREAKDVFAVQEEIAGRIAKELSLKLGVSSAAATARVNPEAFELYLQGRQAWNLRTEDGLARAEELLNRALALEPNFARAVSAVADVWLMRASSTAGFGQFGERDSPEMKRILAQIERALALDPSSAEAHASLGSARQHNWQLPESVRALREAIALNPNYASAHQWLGRTLLCDGYFDEGLAALRRATELDPLSPRILDNYGIGLRLFGRYAEALAADERALALQPGSQQARVFRTLDLSGLGRHKEAVAEARQLLPESELYESFLIGVFTQGGAAAEAEAALKKMENRLGGRLWRSLLALGRPREALALMDAATMRVSDFASILTNPELDPVRQDPRFVRILANIGMTETHARAQAWRAERLRNNAK